MKDVILKGAVCHTPEPGVLDARESAFVVCQDGVCRGVFDTLPESFRGLPVKDCGDCLILPGLTDLHIHAPQFTFRGTGMDRELLDWLDRYTFPEEMRYADGDYARRAYAMFADRMLKSATTRAVIFATVHRRATVTLMALMERTGLISYVGKVNMDRDAPPALTERDADAAAADTAGWLNAVERLELNRTRPILTPRFIPCCSETLLRELSEIRRVYDLPVQSHLSENPGEIELVKKLMPDARFYGDGYDRYGLFGGEAKTVMAHCVWSPPAEVERIRKNGVWVAHCPTSNMNLASGIAPVRRYLEKGLRVGLGSDVAGGHSESLFSVITDALQASKLYWRYVDETAKPLAFAEAFYLASCGGGSFFGKVGCFAEGYEFDALVLDDGEMPHPRPLSAAERLERAVYLGLDQTGLRAKYVAGRCIFEKG